MVQRRNRFGLALSSFTWNADASPAMKSRTGSRRNLNSPIGRSVSPVYCQSKCGGTLRCVSVVRCPCASPNTSGPSCARSLTLTGNRHAGAVIQFAGCRTAGGYGALVTSCRESPLRPVSLSSGVSNDGFRRICIAHRPRRALSGQDRFRLRPSRRRGRRVHFPR